MPDALKGAFRALSLDPPMVWVPPPGFGVLKGAFETSLIS